MRNELTNLLPLERTRTLRRDYFVRLSIVATFLVITLTLIAAILLFPTYMFLNGNEKTQKSRLVNIESTLSLSDDAILSAQIEALTNSATSLTALVSVHSVSAIMRSILTISRPGIILSRFGYTAAIAKNKQSILTISGVAATRDALRNYQLALQSSPLVRAADLPVSAYAKDTDIAFIITVTLTP
ncbi:MAG: hypothetical protein WC887_00885 [Candidatus Paceibacterota bacterium]|jgi:Tfp pilus assembly protein PilN